MLPPVEPKKQIKKITRIYIGDGDIIEQDYVGKTVSIEENDYDGVCLRLLTITEIDNPNYEKELEKYKKAFIKYEEFVQNTERKELERLQKKYANS